MAGSRWASLPRLCRGTFRSCCLRGRCVQHWPWATQWLSNPLVTRACRACCLPRYYIDDNDDDDVDYAHHHGVVVVVCCVA